LKAPDVYIGSAEEVAWTPDTSPDDDKQESTPKEVVQILGFDPADDDE